MKTIILICLTLGLLTLELLKAPYMKKQLNVNPIFLLRIKKKINSITS